LSQYDKSTDANSSRKNFAKVERNSQSGKLFSDFLHPLSLKTSEEENKNSSTQRQKEQ
jgi:hypothetical protein